MKIVFVVPSEQKSEAPRLTRLLVPPKARLVARLMAILGPKLEAQ